MDQSNLTTLNAVDYVPETLTDAVVHGPQAERIGVVSHVHGMGLDTKVVVDVGGFLGIGAKSVLLDAAQLTFTRDADGTVAATTVWTKDELKAMPEHQH